MNDRQKIEEFLRSRNIDFIYEEIPDSVQNELREIGRGRAIYGMCLSTNNSGVIGYCGFCAILYFDKEEKLISVGCWE